MEKRIAKIQSTMLGVEDHGIFTAMIDLNYGGSSQGAGLYALDSYDRLLKERVGRAEGMQFIMRLLQACGVDRWEKLPGRTVYALIEDDTVEGIEPLPTEGGRTFVFKEVFEEKEEEEEE